MTVVIVGPFVFILRPQEPSSIGEAAFRYFVGAGWLVVEVEYVVWTFGLSYLAGGRVWPALVAVPSGWTDARFGRIVDELSLRVALVRQVD